MTRKNYLSVTLIVTGWISNCFAGGGVLLSDDTGNTIFVLDYLHKSLSEVPVDFRIIKNVTSKGEFVQINDIEEIIDIEDVTVFYQKPVIKSNASYTVSHDFMEEGE